MGDRLTVKSGWEGRYFEDFVVGDVYRARIGRTITQADNIQFSLLTNNSNQIHFNEDYAARTPFKRPLVNSVLTLAVTLGLGVPDTSQNGFALGWDKIDLPNPLYEGDTIYSESEVLEVRPSRTHPEWGIVKLRTRGITKDGTVVIDFVRSIMVWKREHAPARGHFPEARG